MIRLVIADPLEECLELGDPRLRARAHRLQDLPAPSTPDRGQRSDESFPGGRIRWDGMLGTEGATAVLRPQRSAHPPSGEFGLYRFNGALH